MKRKCFSYRNWWWMETHMNEPRGKWGKFIMFTIYWLLLSLLVSEDLSYCCGSLTHRHNGLFSPLLLVEISLPGGRSISMLSEQYETSYLFFITLSFLCNIIYYLISVFVFSLVTLSGATTYWRRGTWTKKETLQQAKGVNRTTYWRRYIATTKRYPTTSC